MTWHALRLIHQFHTHHFRPPLVISYFLQTVLKKFWNWIQKWLNTPLFQIVGILDLLRLCPNFSIKKNKLFIYRNFRFIILSPRKPTIFNRLATHTTAETWKRTFCGPIVKVFLKTQFSNMMSICKSLNFFRIDD